MASRDQRAYQWKKRVDVPHSRKRADYDASHEEPPFQLRSDIRRSCYTGERVDDAMLAGAARDGSKLGVKLWVYRVGRG
jgi:hypothetical protein